MKLGIKVGLQETSRDDLRKTNPAMAEVWFDIGRKDRYTALFATLRSMHIDVGLHFWGVLPDTTWTNLAYPDDALNRQSLALMTETVDIAAQNGFSYVNIHPGQRTVTSLDLATNALTIRSSPADEPGAVANFLKHVGLLNTYARRHNILLTVETVPPRFRNHGGPKDTPMDVYELPFNIFPEMAARGIHLANDFAHTAANCDSQNPQTVWNYLKTTTHALARFTNLVHIGFTVLPHFGTDNHASLDAPAFIPNRAVPDPNQLPELLSLFENRDDVWGLVEPDTDHIKNYMLAKKFLETTRPVPMA